MPFGPARLRFIEPQLASPVDQPPEGKHWIHEIKHDGYRSQVGIERGKTRVFSRNGHDWSDRYPGIVRCASNLPCKSAIIDGEAIVQNGDGASDFEALQSAMRRQPHSIILYAFDLLHLDGTDLRQGTLLDRRAALQTLLGDDDKSRIQFSDEFDGDGAALFKACAERGLEGIVSKHALAPYRSGRTRTWLKTKCFTESTFVVIGTDWATFKGMHDVKWCHPKLRVEVKHLAGSKFLRHVDARWLYLDLRLLSSHQKGRRLRSSPFLMVWNLKWPLGSELPPLPKLIPKHSALVSPIVFGWLFVMALAVSVVCVSYVIGTEPLRLPLPPTAYPTQPPEPGPAQAPGLALSWGGGGA